MTHKENITAILECYFTGFKNEIIESACNRILEQELRSEDCKYCKWWKDIDEVYRRGVRAESEGCVMTSEQIINYIGELGVYASNQGWDDEYKKATIFAMEAVKQKSILDSIVEDIELRMISVPKGEMQQGIQVGMNVALDVIRRHMAESEENDDIF